MLCSNARSSDAYRTTITKWGQWSGGVPIENLGRKEILEFLDWVYERSVAHEESGVNRHDQTGNLHELPT
jgi:hypothetical protein